MIDNEQEYAEVSVFFVRDTDSAILVRDAEDVEHWLPKSQIREITGTVGEHCEIELAHWLALQRWLV